MVALAIMFMLFVLLDVVALRWGYDSRDDINGAEWKKRREWLVSHLMYQD